MPKPSAPTEGSKPFRRPVRARGRRLGPLARILVTTSVPALSVLALLREPSGAASTHRPPAAPQARADLTATTAFVRQGSLATGPGPSSLAAGDVDGDADPDLIVASSIGGAAIHVLENEDRGAFVAHPPLRLTGVTDPGAFVAADLDHDRRLDLVVPGQSSGNVAYLRNAGEGRFEAPVLRGLPCETPVQAIACDLDASRDGTEIAVAHFTAGDQLTVLAAGEEAPFATCSGRSVPAGRGIESLAGADLDLDGDLDLACASTETGDVHILLNLGGGRLASAGSWAAGDRPRAIAAADLNGDRRPDLVLVNRTTNTVSVLLQGGDAVAFGHARAYRAGDGPGMPAIADLDGDADLDLAVPGRFSDDVTLLANRGDGTFEATAVWDTDPGPTAAAAADWDGDGALDLAVTSAIADCVTLFRNTGVAGAERPANGAVAKATAHTESAGERGAAPIRVALAVPGHVQLTVFSRSGKLVRMLLDRDLPAGEHQVSWDGTGDAGETLPSGTYFYRLATEQTVDLKRMTLR